MLDTRRLKVLCEVARHGSFSAAAESLGYTQPAVSRQIATLEGETGATLVRRLPQGAELTDAGRLLVSRANGILAQLEDTEVELRKLQGLGGGRLRLAAFASAASSIMPLALMKFRERYPLVELSVMMVEPNDAVPQLASGELDLALSHAAVGAPAVEVIHLFDDPMYVAIPNSHPLAHPESLSLPEFAGEPWLLNLDGTCPDARRFRDACLEAGFEPQVALENDDYNAILGLVAAEIGVAIVPELVTRAGREGVVIRTLDPPLPSRQIVVALPADYRTAAASAMLDVLRDVAAEWVAARAPLPRVMAPAGVG